MGGGWGVDVLLLHLVYPPVCVCVCLNAGSDIVHGWDPSFWRQIGLGDLADEGFTRIGTTVLPPEMAVGAGLSERAGKELTLPPGTPVATAIIDAHAGGLGKLRLITAVSPAAHFVFPCRHGGG